MMIACEICNVKLGEPFIFSNDVLLRKAEKNQDQLDKSKIILTLDVTKSRWSDLAFC